MNVFAREVPGTQQPLLSYQHPSITGSCRVDKDCYIFLAHPQNQCAFQHQCGVNSFRERRRTIEADIVWKANSGGGVQYSANHLQPDFEMAASLWYRSAQVAAFTASSWKEQRIMLHAGSENSMDSWTSAKNFGSSVRRRERISLDGNCFHKMLV